MICHRASCRQENDTASHAICIILSRKYQVDAVNDIQVPQSILTQHSYIKVKVHLASIKGGQILKGASYKPYYETLLSNLKRRPLKTHRHGQKAKWLILRTAWLRHSPWRLRRSSPQPSRTCTAHLGQEVLASLELDWQIGIPVDVLMQTSNLPLIYTQDHVNPAI